MAVIINFIRRFLKSNRIDFAFTFPLNDGLIAKSEHSSDAGAPCRYAEWIFKHCSGLRPSVALYASTAALNERAFRNKSFTRRRTTLPNSKDPTIAGRLSGHWTLLATCKISRNPLGLLSQLHLGPISHAEPATRAVATLLISSFWTAWNSSTRGWSKRGWEAWKGPGTWRGDIGRYLIMWYDVL